ncbi:FimV family protein, partial [Variovorax sp. CT11-76]
MACSSRASDSLTACGLSSSSWAEADVYLAYGRDLQAEEILREALRVNPDRTAIHLKLLEIHAKRRDLRAYESLATEVHKLTGGNGADWTRVVDIAGVELARRVRERRDGGIAAVLGVDRLAAAGAEEGVLRDAALEEHALAHFLAPTAQHAVEQEADQQRDQRDTAQHQRVVEQFVEEAAFGRRWGRCHDLLGRRLGSRCRGAGRGTRGGRTGG